MLNTDNLNNTNAKIVEHHKQGVDKWYNTYKKAFYNNFCLSKKDFATFLLLLFQFKNASHSKIFDYFIGHKFDKLHKCFYDWRLEVFLPACQLSVRFELDKSTKKKTILIIACQIAARLYRRFFRHFLQKKTGGLALFFTNLFVISILTSILAFSSLII